jgi:hypothetical protein
VTFDEFLETLKNINGVVTSALVFIEEKYPLLPLNPRIREDGHRVAALLALVAGFGAHQYAKRSGRLRLGWIALVPALVMVGLIYWFAAGPSFSPQAASLSARIVYVLLLCFSAVPSADSCVRKLQKALGPTRIAG